MRKKCTICNRGRGHTSYVHFRHAVSPCNKHEK